MKAARKSLKTKALAAIMAVCCASAWGSTFHPVRASKAMVVSVNKLASEAGVEVMKAGGNAVDAATATGFALAVVYPQAGNLGGGGFMLVRFADGGMHFLDYREKAPAAARREMYLDAQGKIIPGASTVGYQAVAVPGSVAGMTLAQKKWGKLSLARVMAPAIRLARDGFALAREDAADFQSEDLAKFPESARIFQRNGNFYAAGEIFRQPELARTLERISADPEDFYHGGMARELAAFMQKNGGLLTERDLAGYTVKERQPVHGSYRGYEIYSAPLPSSGGIVLLEALNILEGYNLAPLGDRSAQTIHLVAEAFRRAMFDRAELLGDPDFSRIPVAQLIDKKYAAAWRESIDPRKASPSRELQRPAGSFNELDRAARLQLPERMHTAHYSVVDEAGNAVSVTTTLNDTFGSSVTAQGLGFLLNDEMDDFSSKPGVANMYGLIQGPANEIAPGHRPLSAMTPTIVVKDGKTLLVLGSPGGPRIITTVANILMGVLDFGLDLQQAVNAPRFHHQWLPDSISMETYGFSPDTVKKLSEMGHQIGMVADFYTDGECIMIDPRSGERLGASDGRNNGQAVGY